ncbi:hypothetical protein [Longispora albida]|uniref:hypothetical protein n=1 Tax=Longispora albida TaxID=203523 RepID=UPI0012F72566|nr:hypothetical protein [Longispora albida]
MAGRAVADDSPFTHQAHTWISAPVPGTGVITLHHGPDGEGQILARHAGRTVRWRPLPPRSVLAEATRAVWTPWVNAVAVATDIEGQLPAPALTGLALAVADDLTATRRDLLGRVHPAICHALPPAAAPPDGYRNLPHMVSVYTIDGRRTDRIVWELAPEALLPVLLGGPLPDTGVLVEIHARLRLWLTLRAQARIGQLPATPLGRLAGELAAAEPLTMPIVYRHAAELLDLARRDDPDP